MADRFPVYKADYIFNKFSGVVSNNNLQYKEISISYPIRLDAMAINPSAVCYNDSMIFTPGEVVISVNKFIKVHIKVIHTNDSIVISKNTRRKVLVKHAYFLMKKAIKFKEGLYIDVDDKDIPKHCGFGSSSSTIAAVASAINEMFSHPISNDDLIKYLASNHGEEIDDNDDENLKSVQCIGGGATGGLTEAGIIIIAGKSTTIAKMKYKANILIALPKDFKEQNADVLMKKEEENLWKFKETGEKYSKDIAYHLLHKSLPGMVNGEIKDLADIVFKYWFDMGSIENCSFVYENMINLAKKLRTLYEDKKCEMLTLSSVGPAFFTINTNEENYMYCKRYMEKLNMKIIEAKIYNDIYRIDNYKLSDELDFWNDKEVAKAFTEKKPSRYITKVIDNILYKNKEVKCIDIGCGGGRYSKYLKDKGISVIAVDKYINMAKSLKDNNIKFINASFDNLPVSNNFFDLVLSIGVLHNAVSYNELNKGFSEMSRILRKNGSIILSIFTNDIITDDLTFKGEYLYTIKNRPPMILLSKDKIRECVEKNGLKIVKILDEHITDVGNGGKRNVYSILLQKKD